jgi:hypothetical protein
MGTILVLIVAARALMAGVADRQRIGYLIVLISNLLYVPVSIAHFVQHLNHEEVDWAHAGLGITNLVAAAGVAVVTISWLSGRAGRSGDRYIPPQGI